MRIIREYSNKGRLKVRDKKSDQRFVAMANSWTLTVIVLLSVFMARSQTRGEFTSFFFLVLFSPLRTQMMRPSGLTSSLSDSDTFCLLSFSKGISYIYKCF